MLSCYVHSLDYISDSLPGTIQKARLLHNGEVLDLEKREGEIVVTIPEVGRDPINTVVVLS